MPPKPKANQPEDPKKQKPTREEPLKTDLASSAEVVLREPRYDPFNGKSDKMTEFQKIMFLAFRSPNSMDMSHYIIDGILA